jgi:hypothetical protein
VEKRGSEGREGWKGKSRPADERRLRIEDSPNRNLQGAHSDFSKTDLRPLSNDSSYSTIGSEQLSRTADFWGVGGALACDPNWDFARSWRISELNANDSYGNAKRS